MRRLNSSNRNPSRRNPGPSGKSSPLQMAVFGLLILVFGIIDILLLSPIIGSVLAVIGAVMAVSGWNRHKKTKR